MRTVTLPHAADIATWRTHARALAAANIPPDQILWRVGDGPSDLFAEPTFVGAPPARPLTVPRRFLDLAEDVVPHRDAERFALLYTLLTRLASGAASLDDAADPLVDRLATLAKSVRRDVHKMRAFVRFRELAGPDGATRFVAWFEPDHHIVRPNAPFFERRFATMHWSILTPDECAHWDGATTAFTPGATRADAPDDDPLESTWRTYYASIFNPARLKVNAMTSEMPKKYWKNMPETALIPHLIATAQARTQGMIDASPPKPPTTLQSPTADAGPIEAPAPAPPGAEATTLVALAAEARACTRCPLHAPATQTVFGEGPPDARLMFVGEQPGDQEDLAGHPFVGPAGGVFNRALAAAGIDRSRTYVTNAVKHFKFEPRGKRRIHAKPGTSEIDACRWWIDRERALVRPALTVLLGATAARSLTGKTLTISRERGRPYMLPDGTEAWITVHPSFLLRIEDRSAAEAEYARFVEDLVAARERVAALG